VSEEGKDGPSKEAAEEAEEKLPGWG